MTQAHVGTTVRPVDARTTIIALEGSVTAAAEPALMAAFESAGEGGTKNVVLDFTRLDYLNSSGIGLIVTLLVRANRKGQRLSAFGLTDHYRHIFELTRLSDAIAIHDLEETALQATTN
jgi:anti-anti-sigma factor